MIAFPAGIGKPTNNSFYYHFAVVVVAVVAVVAAVAAVAVAGISPGSMECDVSTNRIESN